MFIALFIHYESQTLGVHRALLTKPYKGQTSKVTVPEDWREMRSSTAAFLAQNSASSFCLGLLEVYLRLSRQKSSLLSKAEYGLRSSAVGGRPSISPTQRRCACRGARGGKDNRKNLGKGIRRRVGKGKCGLTTWMGVFVNRLLVKLVSKDGGNSLQESHQKQGSK